MANKHHKNKKEPKEKPIDKKTKAIPVKDEKRFDKTDRTLPDIKVKRIEKEEDLFEPVVFRSESNRQRFENDLHRFIEKAIEDKNTYNNKLNEYNKIYENELPAKTYPWVDCANTNPPLAQITVDGLVSRYRKVLLEQPKLFTAKIMDESLYDEEATIEDFMDDYMKSSTNFEQSQTSTYYGVNKFGTMIANPIWKYDTKVRKRKETYDGENWFEELRRDFPDPESKGLSVAEYNKIFLDAYKAIQEKGSVTYSWKEEFVTHNAPYINVITPDKWYMYPADTPDLQQAVLVGYETNLYWNNFQEGAKSGVYFNLDKLKKPTGVDEKTEIDNVKNKVEGVTEAQEQDYLFKPFTAYYGIVRYDINNDGELKDYLYTYVFKEKTLIRLQVYDKPKRGFFPFEIIPRENRFYGQGAIERIYPIYKVIKVISDQAIDTTSITTVPSFMGTDDIADRIDGKVFHPGITFLFQSLQDIDKFKQFEMSQPEFYSIKISKYWENLAELAIGISYYSSGQESPTDPRAPASKTIALIREANTRIDNYVKNLKKNTEDMMAYICDLIYENGDDTLPYMTTQDGRKIVKYFPRKNLRTGRIKFHLRGTSVTENRQIEKMESREVLQLIMAHPLAQRNMRLQNAALKTYFMNEGGKWADLARELYSEKEIQQEQATMLRNALDSYMQRIGVTADSMAKDIAERREMERTIQGAMGKLQAGETERPPAEKPEGEKK
jgi:hypothetical protein